jgi:ubiquinone biosynthesis protein Coq4
VIDAATRSGFETMAMGGAGDAGALAKGLRRGATKIGLQALAAKMLHVAVACPARMEDIYDNAANGWLAGPLFTPRYRGREFLRPGPEFWRAFWALLDIPPAERRRGSFTLEAIRLAGLLGSDLTAYAAAAARQAPGVQDVADAARGRSARLSPERLAACPPHTLGGAVWLEMTARGMTGDIVDPERLGLSALPSPLDFVNLQAVQHHVVWAVVAGYSAAQLDELALAAFEMGQFRHHHSSLILGLTMATLAFDRPPGLELVLDCIFQGWTHGRETPLLLGRDWASLIDLPLEAARAQLGVTPFRSPLSAAMRRLGERGGVVGGS